MEITDHVAPGSDDRLRDVLNRYQNVEVAHPVVSIFCEVPKLNEEFKKCLNHDLHLLSGRSQDLTHSEVSIYQKAFVILMEKKDFIGAIEIYAKELLGLPSVNSALAVQTLETAVKARGFAQNEPSENGPTRPSLIHNSSLCGSSSVAKHHQQLRRFTMPQHIKEESLFLPLVSDVGSPRIVKAPDSTSPQDADFFVIDTSGTAAPQPKPANVSQDSKLDRLWELYQSARQDFFKDRTDCYRRTTAARFLRDTIENCINYFEAKKASIPLKNIVEAPSHPELSALDQGKLAELRVNLDQAIRVAEKGSGGKKRSFDHNDIQAPHKPKMMISVPQIGQWRTGKAYDSEEMISKLPISTDVGKKLNDPKEMICTPRINKSASKTQNNSATMTTLSSPLFCKVQDNIPVSGSARRASFHDSRRSLSPRKFQSGYRNREGFWRPRGRRQGPNRRGKDSRFLPRCVGDKYRPSY